MLFIVQNGNNVEEYGDSVGSEDEGDDDTPNGQNSNSVERCGDSVHSKGVDNELDGLEDDFSEFGMTTHRNSNSADLRNIVDYLSIYRAGLYGGSVGMTQEWKPRARKLKGVRMHCKGDSDIQYTATSYPQDHPFPKDVFAPSIFGCKLKFYEPPRQQGSRK